MMEETVSQWVSELQARGYGELGTHLHCPTCVCSDIARSPLQPFHTQRRRNTRGRENSTKEETPGLRSTASPTSNSASRAVPRHLKQA